MGCVLVGCHLFLDLAQPFSCLSSIVFGVYPPEREDLHPFFVFLSLFWRVKICESVNHVHKQWGNVLK
jgi:hypothetical protein